MLLNSCFAYAQQGGDPETAAEVGIDEHIETIQRSAGEWALRSITWVDAFFGNELYDEETNRTRLKLRGQVKFDEHDDNEGSIDVSGTVRLPATEKRLRLIINGGDDEIRDLDDPGDPDEGGSVAVRLQGIDTPVHKLNFDIGVKRRDGNYRLFLRTRYRYQRPLGTWFRRIENRYFLFAGAGDEYLFKLNLERQISGQLSFRSSSNVEWLEDEPGVFPAQTFSLYHKVSQKTVIAYESRTFASTKPESQIDETQLRLRIRRNIWLDWMFLELRPTLAWPQEMNYRSTWRFTVQLEALFGNPGEVDRELDRRKESRKF